MTSSSSYSGLHFADEWAGLPKQALLTRMPAVLGDYQLKYTSLSGSESTRESLAGGTLIPSWNGFSAAPMGGPLGQAIMAPIKTTTAYISTKTTIYYHFQSPQEPQDPKTFESWLQGGLIWTFQAAS